jgi:hypothetical protein
MAWTTQPRRRERPRSTLTILELVHQFGERRFRGRETLALAMEFGVEVWAAGGRWFEPGAAHHRSSARIAGTTVREALTLLTGAPLAGR